MLVTQAEFTEYLFHRGQVIIGQLSVLNAEFCADILVSAVEHTIGDGVRLMLSHQVNDGMRRYDNQDRRVDRDNVCCLKIADLVLPDGLITCSGRNLSKAAEAFIDSVLPVLKTSFFEEP